MKIKPTTRPGEVLLQVNRRDERLLASPRSAERTSPFRIKNILVPIDFSDCSKKALRYAIPLAKEHEAAVSLLYVVPNHYAVGEYGGVAYAPVAQELREQATKELARLIAGEVKAEVPSDANVLVGDPASQIAEFARSQEMDIIVISTHGRTGFRHVLLGSVVEHLIRTAPCPVLVVREHEHEFLA